LLELEFLRGGIRLSPVRGDFAGNQFTLVIPAADTIVPLDGPKTLKYPVPGYRWYIHCGPLDQSHRVLEIDYHGEVPK